MPGLVVSSAIHLASMPVLRSLVPILVAVWLLFPAPGRALDPVQAQADAKSLWQRAEWLKLLHYKPGLRPGHWHSQADDPAFFLAAGGADDPRAELDATLAALRVPADSGDAHAQCRFVARLTWLRSELDLGDLPQPDCAAYREFRSKVQARQAVLIFPSYYLNSPSSMFGHTLLRLDAGDDADGAEYLSFAVNFGAVVDARDNGLFYAFKGLTGGYPGQFEVDQYYKKIREYNRDENRDIWEYPLNLDADETERLIQHLWELRNIRFAYYFFDENCSYRILELLEVARPGLDLTSGFPLTAIPIDTVRAVQNAGLMRGKTFRPSQGTVLRQRLDALPDDLHEAVVTLAQHAEAIDSVAVQALPPATRARLIDAAYKYLRFRQTGPARDPAVAERSFRLLQALKAEAGALPTPAPQPDPASAPDASHGSRRLAVGGWHENDRDYLTLGLRLSLHSLEENRNGFPRGAQINLGNLDVRISDRGRPDIQRFDVIDILSLSPRDRFFKPLSWSVMTGVERQWTEGRERRVVHVNGGAGMTQALWGDARLYGLATGRLEYNTGFRDPVQPALGVRAGLLVGHGALTLNADLGAEQFANGDTRLRAALRQNLQLSRQQALHLELLWRDQQPREEFAIGLRYLHYY